MVNEWQGRELVDGRRDLAEAIEHLRAFLEQTGDYRDYARISGIDDGLLGLRPALSVGDLLINFALARPAYLDSREGESGPQATPLRKVITAA